MDITPLVPKGRQMIQTYGAGAFTIAGVRHAGSVLVFPARTEPWPVAEASRIAFADLQAVVDAGAEVEFLLVGTGTSPAALPAAVSAALRAAGIAVEVMDTGAACRTFNVLLAEDRRLAAALIAIE